MSWLCAFEWVFFHSLCWALTGHAFFSPLGMKNTLGCWTSWIAPPFFLLFLIFSNSVFFIFWEILLILSCNIFIDFFWMSLFFFPREPYLGLQVFPFTVPSSCFMDTIYTRIFLRTLIEGLGISYLFVAFLSASCITWLLQNYFFLFTLLYLCRVRDFLKCLDILAYSSIFLRKCWKAGEVLCVCMEDFWLFKWGLVGPWSLWLEDFPECQNIKVFFLRPLSSWREENSSVLLKGQTLCYSNSSRNSGSRPLLLFGPRASIRPALSHIQHI